MSLTFSSIHKIYSGLCGSQPKTVQTESISRFSRFVIRLKDWFGQSAKSKLVTQPPNDNACPCERAVRVIETPLSNVRTALSQQQKELSAQRSIVDKIDSQIVSLQHKGQVAEQKRDAVAQKLQLLRYTSASPENQALIEKPWLAEITVHAQTMLRVNQTLSQLAKQLDQAKNKCSALESSIKSSEQEIEQLTADIQTKKSATKDCPVLRGTGFQDRKISSNEDEWARKKRDDFKTQKKHARAWHVNERQPLDDQKDQTLRLGVKNAIWKDYEQPTTDKIRTTRVRFADEVASKENAQSVRDASVVMQTRVNLREMNEALKQS